MYLRYFGLNETPFSITPDPAFVFLSARHRDALAHLLYGIGKGGSGGFVQLTGEVGTGKTTLCRCLLEQIPEGTHIALLLNPLVTPRELLAAISEELGIDISESIHSTRMLVDGLNRYLLAAHAHGERVVVIIDEAQNLSPEALEQVRLLTNLETSKEKLLQVVLLGQPELRALLQRRSLRQLAQRITARFHLSPLGLKDTFLYVSHRMQVAGAERNPFNHGAVKALFHRSQGIPRLINIIADRSLAAAYASEQVNVTTSMVHAAASEVQLGERRVKRTHWSWWIGAPAGLAVVLLSLVNFSDHWSRSETSSGLNNTPRSQSVNQSETGQVVAARANRLTQTDVVSDLGTPLDSDWLLGQQSVIWQGLADIWHDAGSGMIIQAACDGDDNHGYACVRDQGSWSKIKRIGLPVVLVLQAEKPSYLLLRGVDEDRLLVGSPEQSLSVSRKQVESIWLGAYFVAWPQAPGWPAELERGDSGPAVATIMQMATRVAMPYHGGQVFDAAFELWLKDFQVRNGLQADGIVGRNTLLYLMTASIEEPKLLLTWN